MKQNPESLPFALVLGCHKIGWSIIRCLGAARIPVASLYFGAGDMGHRSRFVRTCWEIPDPEHDLDEFVERLMATGPAGSVLIPSDDASLVGVSRNLETLRTRFKVIAPPWAVTQQCIEKKHTHALAESASVPAPRTCVPESVGEAIAFAELIGFPCLVKPSVSHRYYRRFHVKMTKCADRAQLRSAYIQAAQEDIEVMIQEFVPGDDSSGANYNALWCRGRPVAEVTAQKVRLNPRSIGFPRVVVNRYIPEVVALGRRLLGALNYDGVACVEFKRSNRDGKYRLMEINPRLNLSVLLSLKCGVNFPALCYGYARDGRIPEPHPQCLGSTYWVDTKLDVVESVKELRTGAITIADFVRPYLSRHVSASVPLSDPGPVLKRAWDRLRPTRRQEDPGAVAGHGKGPAATSARCTG